MERQSKALGRWKGLPLLLFALLASAILFVIWPLFTNPREQQSRQRIEFVQIGKKIKAYFDAHPAAAPLSLENLHETGTLSEQNLQYMNTHQINYIQPVLGGSDLQAILSMPLEAGVMYRFHLNGSITKERAEER